MILSGQGACGSARVALDERKLIEPIVKSVRKGIKVFGVGLGLHFLFDTSEESSGPYFDLLPGKALYSGKFMLPSALDHINELSDLYFPIK